MSALSLKERLPDLLIESLFIVMALLGALAIDEWREERQKKELAEIAEKAVVEEMKENREQLDSRQVSHKAMLEELKKNMERWKKDSTDKPEFDFNYSMALLSGAAWDSARMTQSVQYMPLKRVSNYSKIYHFQQVFIDNQNHLIDKVMTLGELEEDQYRTFTQGVIHRIEILIEINESLVSAYQKAIDEFTNEVTAKRSL